MCLAEHTEHTEAEQGVMTDTEVSSGTVFCSRVGWPVDGMVVTAVLTDSAKSLPGVTK